MKKTNVYKYISAIVMIIIFDLIGLAMLFFKSNIYNIVPLAYLLEIIIAHYIISIICLILWTAGGSSCKERVTTGVFYITGNMLFIVCVIPLLFPITARLGMGACFVIAIMAITAVAIGISVLLGLLIDMGSCHSRKKRRIANGSY